MVGDGARADRTPGDSRPKPDRKEDAIDKDAKRRRSGDRSAKALENKLETTFVRADAGRCEVGRGCEGRGEAVKRFRSVCTMMIAATLIAFSTASASAQEYKLGAYGGVYTGVEGGGAGAFGVRRARTTFAAPEGDASIDEIS